MSGWRRRTFDSPGLTQVPPGPYVAKLARRWSRKIYVTSPGYDNIGEVLRSISVAFEPFAGAYDCDLLFANCGRATAWIRRACTASSRLAAAFTPLT
jgi:hypothetical protein